MKWCQTCSHCIYNIWPSRRWPSSKKGSRWWCYHHSAPACSWALPTTLLWCRQNTAIQIQVSSRPSIQKVLEVSGQLYFWNFSDQHIPSLVWNPRNKKTNKTFSMVDCNLPIAEKLIGDFSSRKRAPSCGRGVAGISVANINRHISTKLTRPRGRCKQCKKNGRWSDTFFGCSICSVHLCKRACFQAYHNYHHLLMEWVYISCNVCL